MSFMIGNHIVHALCRNQEHDIILNSDLHPDLNSFSCQNTSYWLLNHKNFHMIHSV